MRRLGLEWLALKMSRTAPFVLAARSCRAAIGLCEPRIAGQTVGSGVRLSRPSRRTVVGGGLAAVSTAGGWFGWILPSQAAPAETTAQFKDAVSKLVGSRALEAKLVKLELPDLAENGNMVPFVIAVTSPMTADNFVRTITVLSPSNPNSVIATFELSPASGLARVTGRLRLAKSQDVLVIAELSTGQLVSGTKRVEVIVGGCGIG